MLVKKKALGTVSRMWGNTVSGKWVDSFIDMLLFTNEKLVKDPQTEYIHYEKAEMSYHEMARNSLVQKALGDWLFMSDCDHVFAPDMLIRLLNLMEKYKAPVISGIYSYRQPPHSPVAGHLMPMADDPSKQEMVQLLDWDTTKEVIPVDLVGGGCLLVKMDVYKRINEEFKIAPFSIIEGLSEDYSFCARCKKLGIPIYLATKVECHHEISMVLSVEDYINNRKRLAA